MNERTLAIGHTEEMDRTNDLNECFQRTGVSSLKANVESRRSISEDGEKLGDTPSKKSDVIEQRVEDTVCTFSPPEVATVTAEGCGSKCVLFKNVGRCNRISQKGELMLICPALYLTSK